MSPIGGAWTEIATVQGGDHFTVLLAVEIDIATAPALHNRLHTLIATHPARHVVIDLADVEFCDAAGVRSLVALGRLVTDRGGTFRLRAARAHIAWLVEFLGHGELLA